MDITARYGQQLAAALGVALPAAGVPPRRYALMSMSNIKRLLARRAARAAGT